MKHHWVLTVKLFQPYSKKELCCTELSSVASLYEATSSGEAILASPSAKKAIFKTRPKDFLPKQANSQPLESLDGSVKPANTDLWEFLNHKWKLRSEESVHVSPSQCGQAGCQLVTVHSIHYYLGTIPIMSPLSQQLVFNRLPVQTSEKPNSQKKTIKVLCHTTASVNMISRGRNLFWPNERDEGLILL